jgi:hypothetical protein
VGCPDIGYPNDYDQGMTESLSPAERLRRRYKPDPARELVEDLRAELSATDDPKVRQALYDAANEVANEVAVDVGQRQRLTHELQAAMSPPEDSLTIMGEGWRRLALERHPELADDIAAIENAESDAERSENIAALLASGRYAGDPDVLKGLLAMDPLFGDRLASDEVAEPEDHVPIEQELARAATDAGVVEGESVIDRLFREAVEATDSDGVPADA